jgi:signal transduction histidine kinase
MYAQALAEDKKEEATLLLAEKRKLSAIATLGAIILILIIALLYYRGKAKERKAKQSIDGLNRATALQIAELEERNRIEQQLEKKKLGLELHDGLANQLAHLKMLSEIAILDIGKPGTINTLTKINELINTAYETTRDKSHDWYKIKEDTSYAAKISGIVQNALPDELFQKEISIDDYHLNTLPLSTKIELMYIIQESITNVLKHARCTKVMLLIYEEFEHLVFRIKDNGRGLDSRSKSGIGLTSIKERCAELKAKLGISSDKEGTEIVVTIPLHLSM